MAQIHVQRRTGAWLRLLAIIGALVLLWALVRGAGPEPELPGAPGVFLIGDPQDLVNAGVMSPVPATAIRDRRHAVA